MSGILEEKLLANLGCERKGRTGVPKKREPGGKGPEQIAVNETGYQGKIHISKKARLQKKGRERSAGKGEGTVR